MIQDKLKTSQEKLGQKDNNEIGTCFCSDPSCTSPEHMGAGIFPSLWEVAWMQQDYVAAWLQENIFRGDLSSTDLISDACLLVHTQLSI